jgi:hypothetical protein
MVPLLSKGVHVFKYRIFLFFYICAFISSVIVLQRVAPSLGLPSLVGIVVDILVVNVQARQYAQAAVQGWEDDSVASRSKALDSAKAASESAQVLPCVPVFPTLCAVHH